MLCYNCYFLLERPMLKMTPQSTMQDSINHYTEKFEQILEEKTERIEQREVEEGPKQTVEEFSWGDIQMPDKF